MNYDKQLKKYAAQIDNPKYYKKIREILLEAFENDYKYESFNYEDLAYIHMRLDAFYDTLPDVEDQKRMIKFCNSYWVIITDKNYWLGCTPNLFTAIFCLIQNYLTIFIYRIKQALNPTVLIEFEHVNKHLYLCHGGLKAAELLGCDFMDLCEKFAGR